MLRPLIPEKPRCFQHGQREGDHPKGSNRIKCRIKKDKTRTGIEIINLDTPGHDSRHHTLPANCAHPCAGVRDFILVPGMIGQLIQGQPLKFLADQP
jgi:hypothetical protein